MLHAVWRQEMLTAARRRRMHFLRWAYAGVLLVQLVPISFIVVASALFPAVRRGNPELELFGWFFESVVVQHFVFLLLLTPALTAGALTDEKTRGTFEHLLTTAARPLDVVLGKLLSRGAQVLLLSLVTVPLVGFFGTFGGIDPAFPVALLVASAVFVAGLGGLSLLASAVCRQTRDAVLATYALLLLGLYAASLAAASGGGWLADALSPWHALAPDAAAERWPRLGRLVLAWLPVAGVGVGLAAVALRPAYLRQLRVAGRPRSRWAWRLPPVGDDPVAWRERFVRGLAPFDRLRACPRWLGLLAVGLLAAGSLLWLYLERLLPDGGVLTLARTGDLTDRWEQIAVIRGSTFAYDRAAVHGILAALLFTLPVAVRASGAICEERERATWEPLLLTPLTTREIVRGKFRGILRAALPYPAVYLAAVLPPALYFGPGLTEATPIFLAVGAAAVVVVLLVTALLVALGVCCSAYAGGAWRSLFATVGFFYVGSYVIMNMVWAVIVVLLLLAMAAAALLEWLTGAADGFNAGRGPAPHPVVLVVVSILGLLLTVGVFGGLIYSCLQVAENRIDFRERVATGRTPRWKL
jgi:ABC-type Na+ efflux pump permease subunit